MINKEVTKAYECLKSLGKFKTINDIYHEVGGNAGNKQGAYQDAMNLPPQLLVTLTPYNVQQLFANTTAENVVGPAVKLLNWVDQMAQVPYISYSGSVQRYDDYSPPATSSVRYEFETVGHYRLSSGITYGNLEMMQFGTTGLDLVAQKMFSASLLLKQATNYLYWFGYQAGTNPSQYDIQGIITSRYLNNKITLQKKIGGAGYTYEDGYKFFKGIESKFVSLTGGYMLNNTTINVGISLGAYEVFNSLTVLQNNFQLVGLLDIIQQTTPIRIHVCPELTKCDNDKDMIVAIAQRLPNASTDTAVLGYSEQNMITPFIQNLDAHYGKISCGTCGFLPLYPAGIIRYTDVLAS